MKRLEQFWPISSNDIGEVSASLDLLFLKWRHDRLGFPLSHQQQKRHASQFHLCAFARS
jgi:hypothetical protein